MENRSENQATQGEAFSDIRAELAGFEQSERERLGLAAGTPEQWTDNSVSIFTAGQRAGTTLLISGLTIAQDTFLQAALQGQGYNVLSLDCPDNDALRIGKEFGNRGQCNPTYFTVGNLVKYLQHLHGERGMPKEEIIDKYVFVTVGGCGPCRFSMYVTEYRKALRDSGFEGFRVLLASQTSGVQQAIGKGAGIDVSASFYLAVMKALVMGDILNVLMYRVRPFEVEPGATDAAIARCRRHIVEALRKRRSILRAIWRVRKELSAIQVDRTRIKPRVAIIGEFWAMTTEGDGNYQLQRFLESEGGEVDIQLLINWLLFLNWEVRHDTRRRMRLKGADDGGKGLKGVNGPARLLLAWTVDKLARGAFYVMARLMGLRGYRIPDMDELAEISHRHYDNDSRGGEGHMEVGKLLLNVIENKVNMTVSVKPFGCMPSSGVSDGVQSTVTEMYPQAIFLPIETSGDGAVSIYSRVQMQIFKARQAARGEFEHALRLYGLTEQELRGHIQAHPKFSHALHRSPHRAGCSAADLVHEVGLHMGRRPTVFGAAGKSGRVSRSSPRQGKIPIFGSGG